MRLAEDPSSQMQKEGCEVLVHHVCQGIFEDEHNFENRLPKKCVIHHPNSLFTAKKPDYHPSSDDDVEDNNIEELTPLREGYVKSAKERAYEEHLTKQRAEQQENASKSSENSSSDDDISVIGGPQEKMPFF